MEGSAVAIVIPAYNEETSIAQVVKSVVHFGAVIVVDDASRDRTSELAEKSGATVLQHTKNSGYDRALDTGFREASRRNVKYVVTLDADGQFDTNVVYEFIRRLRASDDIVIGNRDRKQRWSERVFAGVTTLLYGVNDPLCGMKGYRIETFRKLGHFDSYGSIGTELALFAVRNGYRVSQVPLQTRERKGESRFGDSWSANKRILRALGIFLYQSLKSRI